MAIAATGKAAMPLPYTTNDEEQRKVITSAFARGDTMFIFDEAHVVRGVTFARAVTAVTYTDRALGTNKMPEYPNRITWMTLGNQVQVLDDMTY